MISFKVFLLLFLEQAVDLAAVSTFLLDSLPPIKSSSRESMSCLFSDIFPFPPFVCCRRFFFPCSLNNKMVNLVILQKLCWYFALKLSLLNWFVEMHMHIYLTLGSTVGEDDMVIGDEVEKITLDYKLEQQITNAIDSRFLLQLVGSLDTFC